MFTAIYIITIIVGLFLLRTEVKKTLDHKKEVPFPAIMLTLFILGIPVINGIVVFICLIVNIVVRIESIDKDDMERFWKKIFFLS